MHADVKATQIQSVRPKNDSDEYMRVFQLIMSKAHSRGKCKCKATENGCGGGRRTGGGGWVGKEKHQLYSSRCLEPKL